MAANLSEMFKNTLGDLLVSHASGSLGESAEGISSALQSIVPFILGALVENTAKDKDASHLMTYLRDNNLSGQLITNASGLLNDTGEAEKLMNIGASSLSYLLGSKVSNAVDLISGSNGLKTSSASSLLKLTTPFVLATVARYISEKSLDATGLKNLLAGQREFIKSSLPVAMQQLLGLDTILETKNNSTSMDNSSTPNSSTKSPISKLLPWIVLLIAALGLFYFVQKGCGSSAETTDSEAIPTDTVKTEPTGAVMDPGTAPVAEGSSLVYTLKDGTKLSLERNSFSAWMVDFLKGTAPNATGHNAATPNCMPFDQVTFDEKTGGLTASSAEQLNQLYIIMKSYPEVIISIEGHTDNQGSAEQLKINSEAKAQQVKTWLERKGIAADRLIASGWGDRNPKTSNDTEEGRKMNHRVETCIVKK